MLNLLVNNLVFLTTVIKKKKRNIALAYLSVYMVQSKQTCATVSEIV